MAGPREDQAIAAMKAITGIISSQQLKHILVQKNFIRENEQHPLPDVEYGEDELQHALANDVEHREDDPQHPLVDNADHEDEHYFTTNTE